MADYVVKEAQLLLLHNFRHWSNLPLQVFFIVFLPIRPLFVFGLQYLIGISIYSLVRVSTGRPAIVCAPCPRTLAIARVSAYP